MNNQPNASQHTYRPDIDGLRAVAVLLVIMFHAFPEYLKAGFIGVDVFFVISGYLISSIIIHDLETGKFSIANFYSRRIRRIFPALCLVLIAVLLFGWFALFPDEYALLGKHVLGGAAFISNFFLWNEVGYFDVNSQLKPLLHLWSLGIEEQYYIVFPLILFLCHKYRITVPSIVLLLCVVSFSNNIYLLNKELPVVDFYSPMARVWELLLGATLSAVARKETYKELYLRADAVCAFLLCEDAVPNDGKTLGTVLSVLGCLLLVAGCVVIRQGGIYPGYYALLPVVGTFFLIAAGPETVINKGILSTRPLVWIGLVSYPLYLWHWPLLSFAKIVNADIASQTLWPLVRLGCIALAFVLSVLTYQLVEKPMRFSREHIRLKVLCLCLVMIAAGSVGCVIYQSGGVRSRYEVATNNTEIREKLSIAEKQGLTDYPDLKELAAPHICRISKKKGENSVALIGDSFSEHLFPGLMEKLPDGMGIENFNASCAVPLIDTASDWDKRIPFREHAYKLINKGYEYILADDKIKTVILSHNSGCSFRMLKDMTDSSITDKDSILERGMRRTFDRLLKAGKKVIVVLQNPELPWWPLPFKPGQKVRKVNFLGDDTLLSYDRKFYDNDRAVQWYKGIFFKVLRDYPEVHTVDLSELFCDDNVCKVAWGNMVLYNDVAHLSIDGSLFVADSIIRLIEKE